MNLYKAHVENKDKETMWINIKPQNMPRDVPNLTIAGVYHRSCANNKVMSYLLNRAINTVNIKHPSAGLLLLVDFNAFSDGYRTKLHDLSQIVRKPTRERAILDKCFTTAQHSTKKRPCSPI